MLIRIHRSHGFTLLEIIIVMILVGIISIVLMLRWPGNQMNIASQTDQLLNDIRYIQSLAMNQNKSYKIDFANNYYEFKTANNAPEPNPLSGESVIHLFPGMELKFSYATLKFDSMGAPYTDNANQPLNHTINITMTDGHHIKTIIINPETGYAQLQS